MKYGPPRLFKPIVVRHWLLAFGLILNAIYSMRSGIMFPEGSFCGREVRVNLLNGSCETGLVLAWCWRGFFLRTETTHLLVVWTAVATVEPLDLLPAT